MCIGCLVSERGVVFFRAQESLTDDLQKELIVSVVFSLRFSIHPRETTHCLILVTKLEILTPPQHSQILFQV